MNESTWILTPINDDARNLSLELGIPVEMAQILFNRNICDTESAHKFLYGTLNDLHDPFLMKGMAEAVERILRAVSKKEKILIFGDYDVDGILSVVMLIKALNSLGAEVDYFIPDRLNQGYGIKEKYIDIVLEKKATLVISVDCGVKAVAFVEKAKQAGVDVIITDHHQPGDVLPEALAILNPVVNHSGYPDKNLAGVGVVFKLIQALFQGEKQTSVVHHYLKPVSIGTIADVVELKGENRLFVKYGLKGMGNVFNPGLMSLLKVCGLNGKHVSVGDVGFRIGPRINAAGRLGETDLALKLFFSDLSGETYDIACQMDKLNSKRQKIEEKIFNQAMDLIKNNKLDEKYKFLILGCEEWHRGVIGIVASKLKDIFYRPVILFAYQDGRAFGSGRSIREFSLIDCLNENRHFFLNYGGHNQAIGCEMSSQNIRPFKKAINAFVQERLSEEALQRKIFIDAKINFSDINSLFLENLLNLAPFGMGNPKPLFLTESAEVLAAPQKIQGKHCKLFLRQSNKIFDTLAWRKGEWADKINKGDRIDLVYSLQFSEYLGEERVHLSLEDFR